ncbi:hypothetical protein JTE90_026247 [Oedothorax gibbosus]|uniref:Uncharacterized protein n=1 Tax=Oedothorax gibbosus TaxID=931172 RepID=A0AAV6U7P9_9ARAC|nr:hypothetical protein JTE90_026247 [Oedothorax gibbosus]
MTRNKNDAKAPKGIQQQLLDILNIPQRKRLPDEDEEDHALLDICITPSLHCAIIGVVLTEGVIDDLL